MTATALMIDAIRTSAHNIPPGTPKVGGYVTGSGDVPWDNATWALFPHSAHIRYDQSPDLAAFARGDADVADIESLAGTVAAFAGLHADAVKARMAKGIEWSTAYASDGVLAAIRAALDAAGPHGWYFGHVDCVLADWSLSEQQAAALVGTEVHGMTCRAVQWASPSSNPATLVPGSSMTLAEANVDLDVAQASWHSPAAPPPVEKGVLVTVGAGGFASRDVASRDGGRTWS